MVLVRDECQTVDGCGCHRGSDAMWTNFGITDYDDCKRNDTVDCRVRALVRKDAKYV